MLRENDITQGNNIVADILEAIPAHTESMCSIHDLCADYENAKGAEIDVALLLIEFLKFFDTIAVDDPDSKLPCIRAVSPSAKFFLNSMAAFMREGQPILSNWSRPGISKGPYLAHEVLKSGAQFLYLAELARTSGKRDATSVRESIVVKAIIKAKLRWKKEAVYLVQYDQEARQYQLIGGHKRKADIDLETAIKREIEEELNFNPLEFERDYTFEYLGQVTVKQISSTYGAHTSYVLDYYQPKFLTTQLILGPNDRWVTKKELINLKTRDGIQIGEYALRQLDDVLPSGLDRLGLSFEQVQFQSVRQLMHERRIEVISLAVTILGVILSIAFFLLS